MNIPQLRFPEFNGEWEITKLENIADVKTGPFGSSLHQHDYVEIGTPIITVEHLDELGIVHKNLPLVSDEDKSRLKSYHLKTGDLVFSRVGSVDRCSIISERENGWLFSGRLLRVRFQNQIPAFFNYQFQLETTKQKVRSIAVGQTMPSINTEILKSIELTFASLPEQTKIASFLSEVDEKIQVLKKKHSLLEQYKKGLMQKLFSQELRFKDEDGNEFPEWEEKQVKELFKVTRGDVLAMSLVSDEIENDHIYPVYSSQTKNRGLAGYYNEYLFEDAITWTTDGAGAGDVNFREGKFYCTNVCGVLLSDEGYANLFIAELLNSVSRKYVSYVGNPKLMNNVMAEISIIIPVSVEEQQKISNFLKSLNVRIKQLEIEISKIENWKKGLLQKMFC